MRYGIRSASPRARRRSGRAQFSTINVTPFVDVMLVLLIVFMISAPLLTAGVEVELPQSHARAVQGTDEPLAITIKPDGIVYIQDREIPAKELVSKLVAIVGEKKGTRIFVRGDKRVPYGKVMAVVGDIGRAGFTRVALITEQPAPSR